MHTSSIRDHRSDYEQKYLICLERRRPQLEGMLRWKGYSWQVAEEATDEAVMEALKLVAAYQVEKLANPWAWLRTVAIRKAVSIRRSSRGRWVSLNTDTYFVKMPANDDAEVGLSKRCRAVRSAVDRLPPELKALVTYVYLEGHTYAEAMEWFGWRPAVINGRLYRVRNLLRSKLSVLLRARPAST